MREHGKITSLPVKTTVGQDGCNLWIFFVIKHLCGKNRRPVNENAQWDVPDF